MIVEEVLSFNEPESRVIDWTKLIQVNVNPDPQDYLQETDFIEPRLWEVELHPYS